MSWLIVELNSGSLDGWYQMEAMARDALASLRERHPAGRWVLLRHVDGDWPIPDSRFWLNVLGEESV